jgi:MATE family multidrug resistance protein
MNLTRTEQYDFLPRFYRLAIANILSNLMIPLAGLISVAFFGSSARN